MYVCTNGASVLVYAFVCVSVYVVCMHGPACICHCAYIHAQVCGTGVGMHILLCVCTYI